jgi:hypothetical protein
VLGYRRIIQGFSPKLNNATGNGRAVPQARHLPLPFHGCPSPWIHEYLQNLLLLLLGGCFSLFFGTHIQKENAMRLSAIFKKLCASFLAPALFLSLAVRSALG